QEQLRLVEEREGAAGAGLPGQVGDEGGVEGQVVLGGQDEPGAPEALAVLLGPGAAPAARAAAAEQPPAQGAAAGLLPPLPLLVQAAAAAPPPGPEHHAA